MGFDWLTAMAVGFGFGLSVLFVLGLVYLVRWGLSSL
jgi:hypothetical protein